MSTAALAPHIARNLRSVGAVLAIELAGFKQVLEIGSGNGQHATELAAGLPQLRWTVSDQPSQLPQIATWLATRGVANVVGPVALDVQQHAWPQIPSLDAIYTANTAHIMAAPAVAAMFAGAGRALPPGGVLLLYGPVRVDGKFNALSNQSFDATLRSQNPAMGIRDLEQLDAWAGENHLRRTGLYAMPANNFVVVWHRMEDIAS